MRRGNFGCSDKLGIILLLLLCALSAVTAAEAGNSYWIETEDTTGIIAPMQVGSDTTASGGKFIYIPNGNGTYLSKPGPGVASYTLNIPTGGTYVLWGRVIATYSSDDSFFVQIDNGTNYTWNTPSGSTWHWAKVKDMFQGNISFPLTAGTHTIKVKHREDGTKIDKLVLTDDLTFVPSDSAAQCGNNIVEGSEQCDDGNVVSGDGCSATCVKEFCGDKIVQPGLGESCDGNTQACTTSNGYAGTQACTTQCNSFDPCVTTQFCGDGMVNGTEQCDDGNTVSGDGCSISCVTEFCGDKIVQAGLGEACDGNTQACTTSNGYAGTQTCTTQCNSFDPCVTTQFCGDGTPNGPEQCDDGNTVSGDGCSTSCVTEFCGDKIVQTGLGEACDGNTQTCTTSDGYAGTQICNTQCTAFDTCLTQEFCGDGFVNGTEQCDDGNAVSGDGCSSTCLIEQNPVSGDIFIEAENVSSIVAPMQVAADTAASQGQYIYIPNGNGTYSSKPGPGVAAYTVEISTDGTYVLWGKVIATYSSDDSFFVQIDNGTNYTWNTPSGSTWHWAKVKDMFQGNISFPLTAGTHTIKVKHREDGTKIDKLLLTNNLNLVPSDTSASNTSSSTGYCGDGIVQSNLGETCEGVSVKSCTTSSGYAGTQSCQTNCTYASCAPTEYCGDGIVQSVEECDDSNTANGDGCSSVCLIEKASSALDADGMARVAVIENQLNTMTIIPTHPRIFLNNTKLSELRTKLGQSAWNAVLADADKGDMISSALGYLMLEQTDPARALLYADQVYNVIHNATYVNLCSTGVYDQAPRVDVALAALAFDWAYNGLTDVQRTEIISKLGAAADITAKKAEIDAAIVPKNGTTTCYKNSTKGETFHREEWAFYAYEAWPEIALAHHHPDAEAVYKARWGKEWYYGDAARAEVYVNDGTPFEGYYFGNDGISWFLPLESATGINLIEGPDFKWNSEAAYYLLYRMDIANSRETMHKGVATSTLAINSFLKTAQDTWKLREHISRSFLPRAKKDPYLQWIVTNKIGSFSSWLMTNNYFGHITKLGNIAKLLFYDQNALSKDPTLATYAELPFDRHFEGGNEAYMRSGWGPKSTIVGFRSKPVFTMTSHSDFDVNTFVIHRDGGPLSPDSGVYDAYQQQKNYMQYQKNTVAHNNLLIIDPSNPNGPQKLGSVADPGGVDLRSARTFSSSSSFGNGTVFTLKDPTANWADITKFESHPDYAYLVGDAREAYGSRLSQYDRNLAFLRKGGDEAYLIIFDRVAAADAAFKKKWLLHTVNEPVLNGSIINTEVAGHIETFNGDYMKADSYEGTSTLHAKFLMPANHSVRRVSGETLHTQGTVSIAYGSAQVVGVGTDFTPAMAGHYFHVNKDKTSTVPSGYDGYFDWFEIASVTDATHLTLKTTYTHADAVNEAYTINQGYQFWVDGTKPKNVFVSDAVKAISSDPVTGKAWQHMGQGRIELMPPDGNKTDYFLVAMYLSDINSSMPANTVKIESMAGTPMYGAMIDNKVVMFSQSGSVVTNTVFTIAHNGVVDALIADLNPGQSYTVLKNGAPLVTQTASTQGTIYFHDDPGTAGATYSVQ